VLFQSLLLGESTWLPSHFDKPLPTKISVQLGEPPQYFKIAFECGWEMKLDRMVRERRFCTSSTMVIRAKAMQSLYASSNPSAYLSTP
jgi:hypothetical protein